MTIIWCMTPEIPSMTGRIFCHFGPFLPFYPPNNPKNQNSKKWKKTPREIIILHISMINDDHMRYGSWDMEHDGQNFSSFWTIFWTFIPLTTPEIKILKNENTTWRYYHFTHMCHKWKSYDVWFLRYGGCDKQNFLSFWIIFCPYTHANNLKNQNFEKIKKTPGDIIILHVYHKWL